MGKLHKCSAQVSLVIYVVTVRNLLLSVCATKLEPVEIGCVKPNTRKSLADLQVCWGLDSPDSTGLIIITPFTLIWM